MKPWKGQTESATGPVGNSGALGTNSGSCPLILPLDSYFLGVLAMLNRQEAETEYFICTLFIFS